MMSRPWSTDGIGPESYPPRGGEAQLRTVLNLLAEATPPSLGTDQDIPVLIRDIAARFNARAALRRDAPRRGQMLKKLAAVRIACERAARALGDVDDATLRFFLPESGAIHEGGELAEHAFSPAVQSELRVAFETNSPNSPAATTNPRALITLSKQHLEALSRLADLAAPIVEADIPPDGGGAFDIIQQSRGSAEWSLTTDVWELINGIGLKDKLTGYIRNPSGQAGLFIETIYSIYYYATGEASCQPQNAERHVQAAIKIASARDHLGALLEASDTIDPQRWRFRLSLSHDLDEAWNTGQLPEWLVDGWQGVLAEAETSDAFADGIASLQRVKTEANRRKQLRKRAKRQ